MPAFAEYMLLPLMVTIPLLCGVAMPFLPRDQVKSWALIISLLVFVLSVITASVFQWQDAGSMQLLTASYDWLGTFGVGLLFGIDSISLWLVLLTTFLMPLTILSTFSDIKHRVREFFMWMLILEAAMIGVFVSRDVILFYVFFEMTLIPMFFLIGIWGGPLKRFAAVKFFIFTLTGSLLTFAGLLYVAWFAWVQTGRWSFQFDPMIRAAQAMEPWQQGIVLLAMLAGFGAKVPLFPIHTWLPLAHTEAPTAGSVILAGVLLKLGTYGLIRLAVPMVPEAAVVYAPWIACLAIVGILYAALICWVQIDIKRLVAYSSVSHLGFCVLGMFALNTAGMGGSVMYMINHGLSTGALFLCVGMIYERYHTRDMNELSGLGRRMPIWSTFMVFFCLTSVGLPGLNGFVGEFLTIFGTFTSQNVLGVWFAAAAGVGIILAAIYILYMVGKVVMGPINEPSAHAEGTRDLNGREIITLLPIAVVCLVIGLYPTPMLKSLEPSVDGLLKGANQVIQRQSYQSAITDPMKSPVALLSEEVTP